MRKQKKGRALSRMKAQREALLLSLAKALFLKGKIKTTEAKAKETRRFAEKLITNAKKGTVASRRSFSFFAKPEAAALAKRAESMKNRKGGYTRIMKLGPRMSNGARMAIIEFVE
ncbi:MAG: 50S ribosomal protein L17 [Candidatus Wildermuthbacteria bacterium]|nr:50S ribosomal protein L17 [Candidatus Wildermuthbacteria bacterium]